MLQSIGRLFTHSLRQGRLRVFLSSNESRIKRIAWEFAGSARE